MDFVTGQTYEVPCVEIILKEDGRSYFLPVIDLPHSDPAFDFPYRHYHIDGRFAIHPRMKHRLKISDGYTLTIILTDGTAMYDFKGVRNQSLVCERSETGLPVPPGSEKYAKWYQGYIGQSCAGKHCPHLGTAMLEHDGLLVCPLHGLTADPTTTNIIPVEIIRHPGNDHSQVQLR
ncbi:MAG TPA: hypothetical protein VFE53_16260 [Mucilaginibacter sp.]|jgi:hypothetical protein|nr:hypothetical protein [Mucilaginibacter sp.]